MIIDFVEKYKDLLVKDSPKKQLETILGEDRGDDLSSSVFPTFDNSDESFIALSKRTSENGFVEKYCLSEENAEKLRKIRKKTLVKRINGGNYE